MGFIFNEDKPSPAQDFQSWRAQTTMGPGARVWQDQVHGQPQKKDQPKITSSKAGAEIRILSGAGSPVARAGGTLNVSCMDKSACNGHMWSHVTFQAHQFHAASLPEEEQQGDRACLFPLTTVPGTSVPTLAGWSTLRPPSAVFTGARVPQLPVSSHLEQYEDCTPILEGQGQASGRRDLPKAVAP